MKTFLKKLFVFLALVVATSTTINLTTPTPTYAEGELGTCRYFLGMTSWDCDVPQINSEDALKTGIWTIAANVLTDMTVIASYLLLGYTIYGGYLYIFSSGDAAKVQNSKKTLNRAFIGIAIVTLANVILSAVRYALLQRNGTFIEDCAMTDCLAASSNNIIENLISWFIGSAGVISLIFVVVGGIGYITSAGDAGKLQKAKQTIIYALVGLAVVALAATISAVVSNIANNAASGQSYIKNTTLIIAKEQ